MTRSEYVSHIWEYKKRKSVYVKQLFEVRKKVTKLQRKVNSWEQQVKRIDLRNKKIVAIDNLIKDFTGVSVHLKGNINNPHDKQLQLAKKLFYKYGMEHGIGGNFLSDYTKAKNSYTASRLRTQFNRSFYNNPENKKMYHKFLNFINTVKK